MPEPINLLVCEYLYGEFTKLLEEPAFAQLRLIALPALCGLSGAPCRPLPSYILAQDCLSLAITGPCVDASHPPPSGVRILSLTQCQEPLAGKDLCLNLLRQGCYLITHGWLKDWQRRLDDLGFDQPTAAAFFAESTTRLVLLDSGIYPDSSQKLEALAAHTGRLYEIIPVGLGHLRLYLQNLLLDSALETTKNQQAAKLNEARTQIADYTMAFDILGDLALAATEQEAVDRIRHLFVLLFAPRDVVIELEGRPDTLEAWRQAPGDCFATESREGFLLTIGDRPRPLALALVEGVKFPARLDSYMTLALNLRKVCSLAITNARNRAQVAKNQTHMLELRRVQSLVDFAGGLAHDFNNLMTIIAGNLELLRIEGQGLVALDEPLGAIDAAAQRVNELMTKILSFSGRSMMAFSAVDLPALLRELVDGLPPADSHRCKLELGPLPAGAWLKGSAEALDHVAASLVINALEATEGQPKGTVIIRCGSLYPGDELLGRLDFNEGMGAGPVAFMSVKDDGPGMDEAVRSRAFDPFFSTKFAGRGLGLPSALGLVRSHGGAFGLFSTPGQGAEALVLLPLMRQTPG